MRVRVRVRVKGSEAILDNPAFFHRCRVRVRVRV